MLERRRYERLILEGDVSIKTKNGNLCILRAYLNNISFGGFAMYAQERIDVDKIVEFELKAQISGQPLVGKGKIRYVNAQEKDKTAHFTMGVEFTEINKDAVLYLINRLQAKLACKIRDEKKVKPLDFLPY